MSKNILMKMNKSLLGVGPEAFEKGGGGVRIERTGQKGGPNREDYCRWGLG